MRLLLVEDDVMIAQALQSLLVKEQYVVDWAADGVLAEAMASAASYDLVLLDLGLPGKDGLQVLRMLRARGSRVPLLVATARDTVQDRIGGLDAGADDYVLKPFDFHELLARIRALIRRAAGKAEGMYHYKDIVLDPARHEASLAGQAVSLSAREWAVLEPLILRPGLVLSRQQLEEKLYGWDDEISSNAIEVYVHGIRKKLGAELIQNVRGLGYLVPRP